MEDLHPTVGIDVDAGRMVPVCFIMKLSCNEELRHGLYTRDGIHRHCNIMLNA